MTGSASARGEPFRHDPRVVLPAQALADDHELVATEPCDGVGGLQAPLDPPRDLDEQLVAGVVAQAVVDHLEAVDVEEQHGDLAGAPREAEESLAEAVEEERAIRQLGQRIVERLVLESVLGVGPVHCDGGERGDPLDDRHVDGIRWALICAVDGDHAQSPRVRRQDRDAPALRRLPPRGDGDCVAVGSRRVGQPQGAGAVAELRVGSGQEIRERRPQRCSLRDPFQGSRGRSVEDRGPLVLGDVAEVADEAPDVRLVEQVRGRGLEPAPSAVRVAGACFGDDGPSRTSRDLPAERGDRGAVVGMSEVEHRLAEELFRFASEESHDGRADVHEAPVLVADRDGFARVGEEGPELDLPRGDLVVGAVARADEPHQPPTDEAHDRDAEGAEDHRAVGTVHPDVEGDHHRNREQRDGEDQHARGRGAGAPRAQDPRPVASRDAGTPRRGACTRPARAGRATTSCSAPRATRAARTRCRRAWS